MPSSEIKRRRAAAYRKGHSDGMAVAALMMQEIADKAENATAKLVERWTSDLGATDTTRAAGVAAWIIGGFHGEIVAAQIKLERKDLEDGR